MSVSISNEKSANNQFPIQFLDKLNWLDIEDQEIGLVKKCLNASANVRKEANKIYIANGHDKDTHRQLLMLYSKCIALALRESEELALGYSNRSALLKHLGKYKEAIIDIERAVNITKSGELKKKLLLRKEDCLKLIKNNKSKKPMIKNLSTIKTNYKRLNHTYTHYDNSLPNLPHWMPAYGTGEKLQLPDVKMSKEIPCIADCVSLEYNEKCGKHMVATRDIRPGEIVAVEKCFVVAPVDHQRYLVCSNCLAFSWNGIPCDSCPCVIYCSEKCKKEAWDEYHDIECLVSPYLCKLSERVTSISCPLMITRIFLKFFKKEGLTSIINDLEAIMSEKHDNEEKFILDKVRRGSVNGQVFRDFITSYAEGTNVMDGFDRGDFNSSIVLGYLIKYTTIFDELKYSDDFEMYNKRMMLIKKLLIKLFCILDANIFGFSMKGVERCDCKDNTQCSNNCLKDIGANFASICSFFNHSCINNTGRTVVNGDKMVLFAVSPVKKGEQLCISYGVDLSSKKEVRDVHFKNNFICKCQACTENWPRRFNNLSFQALLSEVVTDVNLYKLDLYKLLCDENINFLSLYDFDRNYYSEKILQDNVKVVEMAYNNYNPVVADTLSSYCRINIQSIFDGLYGYEFNIPDNC